jgi:hypothetical protein
MRLHCTVDGIEYGAHFSEQKTVNRLVIRCEDGVHSRFTFRVLDDGTYRLGDTFDLVNVPSEPTIFFCETKP